MHDSGGEDTVKLSRKRNISFLLGICLMVGGFGAAVWGAATLGQYPEWYNGPVVWFLVVWIPGMFFVQDSVSLHVKVLAHNKARRHQMFLLDLAGESVPESAYS